MDLTGIFKETYFLVSFVLRSKITQRNAPKMYAINVASATPWIPFFNKKKFNTIFATQIPIAMNRGMIVFFNPLKKPAIAKIVNKNGIASSLTER